MRYISNFNLINAYFILILLKFCLTILYNNMLLLILLRIVILLFTYHPFIADSSMYINIIMQRKLLVIGGSGFVGNAICRYALTQGVKVYSLSRSGRQGGSEPWKNDVEYIRGDALNTASYKDILTECDAVIHTVGILLDTNTFSTRSSYEGSYEHMNRDTALAAVKLLEGTDKTFVYLSAERGVPVAPRYLSTKREVEDYLKMNSDKFNYAIVRPGFMYSDQDYMKKCVATGVDAAHWFDSFYRQVGLGWFANQFVPAKSLPVDMVAKVAVLSAFKPDLRGRILDVRDIEEVAQQYHSID